ncbi:MAG TPA: PQQ-dependent sugar dehydrogenase [Gemmatimonadaceae bacterium]|nr:PQQ-dependent sugar dehydrogenase [Gemmatimonadaceae bacterium]
MTAITIQKVVVSLLLGALVAGCGDSSTPPPPAVGALAVEVGGLPAGAVPAVTISGPSGYSHNLTSSETLPALEEGSYTLTAADVTAGGVRYAATPPTQTVTVVGDAVGVATTIKYAAATGRLTLTVSGLVAPAAAAIAVSGPNGFARTVTTTTTLDVLAPGNYTLTTSDVQAGGKTYHPDPATQTVAVSASPSPAVTAVAYGAGTAAIDLSIAGLPAGTDAAVTVTGADALSRPITTSTTLRNLEAGSYTIAATTVASSLTTHAPAVASQSVNVTVGGTVSATVTYGSAPLQLALQPVVSGLINASFATSLAADSRLFIVERVGRVRIFKDGALLATPFFDISDHVNSVGERGMLSIAFDPDYATNGYVYAYYTDALSNMIVERLTSTPGSNTAAATGTIVINIGHGGKDHHGGLITFGPDGMLYVAPGDGGCCGDPNNNAQNLTSFLGKILRLNVRTLPYTIPAGNPFVSQTGRVKEIWAYGLRNPWRYSFDPPTGLLLIGDVGQDSREEVDVVSASTGGTNFGWRLMEATACYIPTSGCNTGALTLPAIDYPHSDGCSVIGGYVYRGAAIPELTGHYLYADYCNGWLRSFRAAPGTLTERQTWAVTAPGTLSFGRDGAGELYLLSADKLSKIVRQ